MTDGRWVQPVGSVRLGSTVTLLLTVTPRRRRCPQDLLRYLPPSHPDHRTMGLAHALTMTQSFISKYNVAASGHPVSGRRSWRSVRPHVQPPALARQALTTG